MHAREVGAARTYDDFLAVVLRHVGDVRHSTKEVYNCVVEHVIHIAEQQGTLNSTEAHAMQERLDAAFADLRGTISRIVSRSCWSVLRLGSPSPSRYASISRADISGSV